MWKLCVFCLVILEARSGAGLRIVTPLDNTTAEVGGTATFTWTTADGSGQGYWKKDGQYLDQTDTRITIVADTNLTITNVSISDAGLYLIDYGSVSSSAYLTVVDLPGQVQVYWSSSPEDGSTANLTCEAVQAYPPPSLSWLRNGVALTSATTFTSQSNDSTGYGNSSSTLEVAVRAADVGDVYKCSVDFTDLTAAVTANVTLVLSSIAYSTTPSNSSVLLGNNVTLSCTLTGRNNDEPVTWYKDGHALTIDGQQYQQLKPDFNLTVTNTTKDDAGLYSCDVSTLSAQASLTVVELPTNLTVYWVTSHGADSTANLTCHAQRAYPPPSLSWYRDNVALTSATTFTSQSSDSSGYGDSYSTLQVGLTSQDEGTRFTCSVDYPGWTGAMTRTLTTSLSGAEHVRAGALGLVLSLVVAGLHL